MKVFFGQIYGTPGVCFPFSHFFQQKLSQEVSRLVTISQKYINIFGSDYELMFRISAKKEIDSFEIMGPTVFGKDKDVEYTVFLPYDSIMASQCPPKEALLALFCGISAVFISLDIDISSLLQMQHSIIEKICSDASMVASGYLDGVNTTNRSFIEFFHS
jgi:hypothetical protein